MTSNQHRLLRSFVAAFIVLMSVSVLALPGTSYAAGPPDAPDPPQSQDGANNAQGNAALTGLGGATGQAARTGLASALARLDLWSTPDITAKDPSGSNWFLSHYRMMRVMGLYILMPMVLIAIIHAVFKASMNMLLKTVFVFLPISIIGTVVAIDLVQLTLNVTDDFSRVFSNAVQNDADQFFNSVAAALGDTGIPIALQIVMGIFLALVCVALYVIMIVREGSIYLATSFLPVGFALLVWPSTARWFKRLVEFLFGIIISKVVMMAAISLAIAAIVSAAGLPTTGAQNLQVNGGNVATANPQQNQGDNLMTKAGNVLSACALLLVVCLAPHMTIRLVANLGIGEMASHAGNAMMRPSGLRQLIFFDRVMNNRNSAKKLIASFRDGGQARRDTAPSYQEQVLNAAGITGDLQITNEMLDKAGITDLTHRQMLKDMTDPNLNRRNADLYMRAHFALAMGKDFNGFRYPAGGEGVFLDSKSGKTNFLMNITNSRGRVIRHHSPTALRRVLRDEADRQIAASANDPNGPGIYGINVIMPQRSRADEFANGGRRARGRGIRDRRDERSVAKIVWETRQEYRGPGGETPPIRATFRAPAGTWSRMNRPLHPDAAEETAGHY